MDSRAQDAAEAASDYAGADLETYRELLRSVEEPGANVALAICLAAEALCARLMAEGIRIAEAVAE